MPHWEPPCAGRGFNSVAWPLSCFGGFAHALRPVCGCGKDSTAVSGHVQLDGTGMLADVSLACVAASIHAVLDRQALRGDGQHDSVPTAE